MKSRINAQLDSIVASLFTNRETAILFMSNYIDIFNGHLGENCYCMSITACSTNKLSPSQQCVIKLIATQPLEILNLRTQHAMFLAFLGALQPEEGVHFILHSAHTPLGLSRVDQFSCHQTHDHIKRGKGTSNQGPSRSGNLFGTRT